MAAQDFVLRVDGDGVERIRTMLRERTVATLDLDDASRAKSRDAAAILLSRMMLGENPHQVPELTRLADVLSAHPPTWSQAGETIDYEYWYFGTTAMFHLRGSRWNAWQPRVNEAILRTQRTDGDAAGSWDPQFDPGMASGGRVEATALLALCLQVYYRYDHLIAQ